MLGIDNQYLNPTPIIDSDHKKVIEYAQDTISDAGKDPIAQAIKLYYAVRDGIWYDPYYLFYRPEHYRASNILRSKRGFCVSKATLLCALGRACGIPSRVGFATVKNHLATKQLLDFLGSDLFPYHGFAEFYLEGKWVKATPAFNIDLCKRHNVIPLEFDGREDSIFHAYNLEKKQFMEYVEFHGSYADIPVQEIVAAFKATYGKDRVEKWIDAFEKSGGKPRHDFSSEEVWKGNELPRRKRMEY